MLMKKKEVQKLAYECKLSASMAQAGTGGIGTNE